MQTVADNNKTDDSALLCHLLCQYTGAVELVIRIYQSSFNNLPEKLEEFVLDVDKLCNYTSEMLKTLHDAGGNDKQASLKLYNALLLTAVDAFSSEIRAYKAAIAAKNKHLGFTKLTTIACAKYTFPVMCSQWPSLPARAPHQRKGQLQ
eukprot:8799447-Ditylum_brightwellii.AAC.1